MSASWCVTVDRSVDAPSPALVVESACSWPRPISSRHPRSDPSVLFDGSQISSCMSVSQLSLSAPSSAGNYVYTLNKYKESGEVACCIC